MRYQNLKRENGNAWLARRRYDAVDGSDRVVAAHWSGGGANKLEQVDV
jgi:hypothetical protein